MTLSKNDLTQGTNPGIITKVYLNDKPEIASCSKSHGSYVIIETNTDYQGSCFPRSYAITLTPVHIPLPALKAISYTPLKTVPPFMPPIVLTKPMGNIGILIYHMPFMCPKTIMPISATDSSCTFMMQVP